MFATEEAKSIKQPNGKSNSILWVEAVAFSLIIVLSWLTEAIRIPHLIYGESFVPNWHRAILRTVVIFLIWAWVHLSTKQLLKRLHHLEEFLRVCSWCHKVCHDGDWLEMERYLTSKFETKTTHGMCPHCLKKKVVEIAAKEPTTLTSSPERSRNTP